MSIRCGPCGAICGLRSRRRTLGVQAVASRRCGGCARRVRGCCGATRCSCSAAAVRSGPTPAGAALPG
eukprot:4214879-Prymnesium_polylepis.1